MEKLNEHLTILFPKRMINPIINSIIILSLVSIVIADFTTPGESHLYGLSPVPLQTPWTPWTIFCPLMFPRPSLKTCVN